MKFPIAPSKRIKIFAFIPFVGLAACRSTNASKLDAERLTPTSAETSWVLLPNLQDSFDPRITKQISDPKNPGEPAQICMYFDRSANETPSADVQPNVLQLWLERGEFCGDVEIPNAADQKHQFLGAKALGIKQFTDVAWTIYLGQQAIGNATIDASTGLPLIQSLCSGSEFGKACRIVATPDSIRIAIGN